MRLLLLLFLFLLFFQFCCLLHWPINFGNLPTYTFNHSMSFLFHRIAIVNMIPFIILFIEWWKNAQARTYKPFVDVFNNSQFTRYLYCPSIFVNDKWQPSLNFQMLWLNEWWRDTREEQKKQQKTHKMHTHWTEIYII